MVSSRFDWVRIGLRASLGCAVLTFGPVSSAQSAGEATGANSASATEAGEPAASEAQRELEAAFWKGEDLFGQGAYAEAAVVFTKALELSQRDDVSETWRKFSPAIAFNVASSYRHTGNCEGARMAYAHYAGLVHEVPAEHVAWHTAFLEECPEPVKKPAPAAEPAHGGAVDPAPSGRWLLDVNAPPKEVAADISSAGTDRILGWSAAGVGVVTLGAAGVIWLSASHFDDQAESKRLWAEAEEYSSKANARRIVAGVLAGAGLVLGGVSVYLLTQPRQVVTTATPISPALSSLELRSNGTNIALLGTF